MEHLGAVHLPDGLYLAKDKCVFQPVVGKRRVVTRDVCIEAFGI